MAPILTTERLLLQEFVEEDAAAFHALNSDPAVIRYTGGGTRSVEHAREILRDHPIADYRKHGFGRLACLLKSDGRLIGFSGLKYLDELQEVDIGYRFLAEFWGRGLATESALPFLSYGFETLGLERIIGLVEPANVRSVRVLEKLGMSFEGLVDYCTAKVARYGIGRAVFRRGEGR